MTLCLAYLFWLHLRRNTSPLNASSRAHLHACTMPPLFYWLAFSLLSCPFASCSHRVSAPVWHPSYVAPSIDACLRVLRILHLRLRSLYVASAVSAQRSFCLVVFPRIRAVVFLLMIRWASHPLHLQPRYLDPVSAATVAT